MLQEYKKLLKESNEKLSHIDLDKLKSKGIKKHREMRASSAINVTYPPFKLLPKIDSEEIIFPNEEPLNRKVTLYLNLPFCTGKCIYCGLKTYVNQPTDVVNKYLDALKEELSLLLDKKELQGCDIASLYIGGGTPTSLSTEQLENLLKFLSEKIGIGKGEFTVESSPETLTKEKIDLLLKYNVNRLSMGVQTFDDETLKIIGRRHNSKQAIDAFEMAKQAGFENINIDLIRSLPQQDSERIYKDLETIEKLCPPSVTSYHLIVKPNSVLNKTYLENPKILPGQKETLLLHLMFLEGMKQIGYEQGPVDWFSLQPKYHYKQQEQKWKENIDLIGLGTTAYSYFNDWQYYNTSDLNEHMQAVKSGKLPIERGYKLNNEEKQHRKLVFGLKYSIKNEKFNEQITAKIKELSELGLLEVNDKIELSPIGVLFADEICREFYSEKIKEHERTGTLL